MTIMPAGVHHVLDFRFEGDIGEFVYGERVDVGAEQDSWGAGAWGCFFGMLAALKLVSEFIKPSCEVLDATENRWMSWRDWQRSSREFVQ